MLAKTPCRGCAGTRLVAPDAFFGPTEPWDSYAARAAEAHAAAGWPASSSAIDAGLIRPVPCPACSPATAGAHEAHTTPPRPVLASRVGTDPVADQLSLFGADS